VRSELTSLRVRAKSRLHWSEVSSIPTWLQVLFLSSLRSRPRSCHYSLIDLNNTFCKNSNENTTPFDMGTVEKMEALVMSVKDKAGEAHAKIESKRLEDFFDKKKRAVEEINEKTRTWAKRVKTLVRANKTLEQDTDCYSKVMVQVTLDDPIANRLTENDDNVDKINYVKVRRIEGGSEGGAKA